MSRLFGTDGVRGRAGHYPLDPVTVRRLGAALVKALGRTHGSPRVLIGRDTRESGVWIERELAHGAESQGARATSAGVMPTPAIAFLTRAERFDAGLVISASHNPYEDNGIKVFSGAGEKYTEQLERVVEDLVADPSWQVPEASARSIDLVDLVAPYAAHVRAVLERPEAVHGWRIGLDCANGATARVAPALFHELGMRVELMGVEPDGRNINLACGSTHPERLAALVRDRGCRLGVAFDGDGDRAIFVDHTGRIVDGDAVMLTCATHLKGQGLLRGDAIVATVMSNLGLEIGLRQRGIALVRCPVGDKYVMEALLARNLALGGEQSGHVIFADWLYTGDGLITTLNVLNVMAASGRELAELASALTPCPQVLLNVRVREKVALTSMPTVAALIARAERQLADRGRVLVRYSGTEPLLRVMLEGQDEQEIRALGEEIAAEVRRHVG